MENNNDLTINFNKIINKRENLTFICEEIQRLVRTIIYKDGKVG